MKKKLITDKRGRLREASCRWPYRASRRWYPRCDRSSVAVPTTLKLFPHPLNFPRISSVFPSRSRSCWEFSRYRILSLPPRCRSSRKSPLSDRIRRQCSPVHWESFGISGRCCRLIIYNFCKIIDHIIERKLIFKLKKNRLFTEKVMQRCLNYHKYIIKLFIQFSL